MMGGNSGAAPADFDKALGILAWASDPEAVKARLIELRQVEVSVGDAQRLAKIDAAKLADDKLAFEAASAERERKLDERQDAISTSAAEVNRLRDQLNAGKTELESKEAAHAAAVKAHTERVVRDENDISAKRAELTKREEQATRLEVQAKETLAEAERIKSEAEALKDDYQRRIAKIKAAAVE